MYMTYQIISVAGMGGTQHVTKMKVLQLSFRYAMIGIDLTLNQLLLTLNVIVDYQKNVDSGLIKDSHS